MARRKELKNIASGLFGSFISRNNDVDGYWGIGKLRVLSEKDANASVHIDLMNGLVTPASAEFNNRIAFYHQMLYKNLAAKEIPLAWVTVAIVQLDFMPAAPNEKPLLRSAMGNLFKLKVTITDDKHKNHTVCGYTYCHKHNPKSEIKSNRADN